MQEMDMLNDVTVNMVINYILIFAGIFVCFTAVFYKKITSVLTGGFWGLLGGMSIAWILTTLGTLPIEHFEGAYFWGSLILAALSAGLSLYSFQTGMLLNIIFVTVFFVYSYLMPFPVSVDYVSMIAVMVIVGVIFGVIVYRYAETGFLVLSAFSGAFAVLLAAVALQTKNPFNWPVRYFMNGSVLLYQGRLAMAVLGGLAGILMQRAAGAHKKQMAKAGKKGDGSYTVNDLMWKHWLLFAVTVLLFLADTFFFYTSGYATQAIMGIFAGGIAFFVWQLGPASGFLYQLLYLIKVALGIWLHPSDRMFATTEAMIFEIAQYMILWLLLSAWKQATGMRKQGMLLSVAAIVLLYPYGINFLKGSWDAGLTAAPDIWIFWAGAVVGELLFWWFGNPDTVKSAGHRYAYKKNHARYCRKCGGRRKVGYTYCGNCRRKYRAL